MNTLRKARLDKAILDELKRSYMSIKDLVPDKETTKALVWFDEQYKELIRRALQNDQIQI